MMQYTVQCACKIVCTTNEIVFSNGDSQANFLLYFRYLYLINKSGDGKDERI
jgi:hypothetical protein